MGEETYKHVFVDAAAGDLTTRLAKAGGSLPTPTGGLTGRLGGETDDDDEPAKVCSRSGTRTCTPCAVVSLCLIATSHFCLAHRTALPCSSLEQDPASSHNLLLPQAYQPSRPQICRRALTRGHS